MVIQVIIPAILIGVITIPGILIATIIRTIAVITIHLIITTIIITIHPQMWHMDVVTQLAQILLLRPGDRLIHVPQPEHIQPQEQQDELSQLTRQHALTAL
jgi:hypothetical protein